LHHRFALIALIGITAAVSGCGSSDEESRATKPAAASPGASTADGDAWIIYQSEHGLRRVLPNGFNANPVLSEFATNSLHPDFSPDGKYLAFNVDDPDGTRDLWTSSWDGVDPVRLVDCIAPCRDVDSPAWSPDSTSVAFVRIDNVDGHNPGSLLQVVDLKSGDITTVYATKGADYLVGPRWSPDGMSMVAGVERFIDDGNDTEEITGKAIVVIHLDRTPAVMDVIRPFEDFASYPDWHPTKDLILFEQGGHHPLDPADPPQNVFTARPDGSDVKQVTRQGLDDDGLWMATFRTDSEGILATRVARPSGDRTIVSIALDGTITDVSAGSPRLGAHPRQRRPVG
jgi:Tol biopolymer transport system component